MSYADGRHSQNIATAFPDHLGGMPVLSIDECPSGTTFINTKHGYTIGIDWDTQAERITVCLYYGYSIPGEDEPAATITCGESFDDGIKAFVVDDNLS